MPQVHTHHTKQVVGSGFPVRDSILFFIIDILCFLMINHFLFMFYIKVIDVTPHLNKIYGLLDPVTVEMLINEVTEHTIQQTRMYENEVVFSQ